MRLLLVEARRALHRRAVWALLAVALLGIVAIGVIAFTSSAGQDTAALQAAGEHHPSLLADWWSPDGDSVLAVTAIFLVIGGFIGGAAVIGGEWKAGTVSTVLVWEPRRLRLHAARLGACGLLAWLLAVALQAVALAAVLPAVLANGSTDGADAAWAAELAVVVVRIGGAAALAAVLGGAIATLGRSTASALVVVGVWMAVIEALLRAWRPGLGRVLLGENLVVLVSWQPIDDAAWAQPVAVSLALLAAYVAGAAAAAGLLFHRRDVGSA